MGFKFSSFAAGAAEAVVDTLRKDEEEASKVGVYGVKALKENYDKVMADNRKLEDKLLKNRSLLKTFDGTATDAELFAAATNDAYMELAIEAAKANPATFKVGDVVKIREANASNKSFEEAMKAYTSVPEVSKIARQAEGVAVDKDTNFFAKIRKGASDRAGTRAEEQTAKAMGVSLEKLRAAEGFKRPEFDTGAEFDLTKFQKPKEFKDIKDRAQVDLLAAQESGEPNAVNAATEKIARINTIESIGKVDKKTDAQIQSDLVTEIQQKQAAGDKQGVATATALLRQRQALMKAPGADGKTDADKISQTNLIQVATRTRATTIEQKLPPGQLITTTDAQGNVTMTLRDLSQGDLFRQGDAIAANAIIKEMAKPDGTPRSEMHKNAMMSVGIRFDDAGKAIRPVVPELPAKGGKTPPPPPPPPPAAAPTAAPARGGPTPATPAPAARSTTLPATTRPAVNVGQLRTEANAVIAQGADRAAVAARFKQATGQEL
jgi:hypothetical protein